MGWYDDRNKKELAEFYTKRQIDPTTLSIAECAKFDALWTASHIQPGSHGPDETTWPDIIFGYRLHFQATDWPEYRRAFLEEYTKQWEHYWQDGD